MADTTLTATARQAPRRPGAGRAGDATHDGSGGEAHGVSAEFRWQRWAACRDTPTGLFFPAGPPTLARTDEERAKTVCSACRLLLTHQGHDIGEVANMKKLLQNST